MTFQKTLCVLTIASGIALSGAVLAEELAVGISRSMD